MNPSKLRTFSKQMNKGKLIAKNSYILIYCPSDPFSKHGYVLEHRLVVEAKIGRLLTKEESIHHLDHNRSNNDIDNLMLFPTQSAHKSFENKVKQFGMTNPIKREIENRWNLK